LFDSIKKNEYLSLGKFL